MVDNTRAYNMDCMIGMKSISDKFYDLAIVDPPYGIGEDGGKIRTKVDRPNSYLMPPKHKFKGWDVKPDVRYWEELFRVSKNQIIWGGNFFADIFTPSSCWIVWDKNIGGDQADCELAWTNFDTAIRKFFGHPFIELNGGKDRIHPTQKPVKLYKWLLKNYAKEGDKILDTHLGSGSSRIAAFDMGFDFTGYELDKDYFEAQEKRFRQHKAQLKFDFSPGAAS